jgi:hypothetical protein
LGHLLACIGISVKHSGHFLVVGSIGGFLLILRVRELMGRTMKKYTVAEIIMKDMRELIKSPYKNLLLFMVKLRVEKSGAFTIAEIKGLIKSLTRALTIEPNAAPIMTPTAKSTTFPLNMNCLNPFSILFFKLSQWAENQLPRTQRA